MNNKMIDGVRAALTEMAVAESMAQHELEAAQEAARNAAAEAVAEGYYKDQMIKKQDKKMGNTKEEAKYPHMMYDPKTGKEVEAKSPEDHEKYAKMGYTHDKPEEMDEAVNMAKVRSTYNDIMKGGRRGPPDDDEVGDYIGKGMTKADIAALIKMLAKQGYDAKFLTKDLAPLAENVGAPQTAAHRRAQRTELVKQL